MKFFKSCAALSLATTIFLSSIFTGHAVEVQPKKERQQYTYKSNIINISDAPKSATYDVVVFGSDPEGVAAAYSAGVNGLKVLLVDYGRDRVGGLYTKGWLNMIDFNYAKGQEQWYANVYRDNFLNHGVFEKFYNYIGSKKAFDINDAQRALEKLLADGNVEVVLTSDDKVSYNYLPNEKSSVITINTKSEPSVLSAKVVIDATPNADIATLAGAKFHEGKEDIGLKGHYQSATLVYKIKGVNWEKVSGHLQNDNDKDSGANGNAAWGYKQMLNAPVNNPNMQSRHLNLGRQNDGTVLVNAFQIFEFRPYDKIYQIQVRDEAIRRIKQDIIPYMRTNLKGFENVSFVSAAPEFYIRETRHLIGESTLKANDVFDSVFPSDFIAVGSYPIDIQAKHKGDIGTILTGTKPYGVSAGVMIPKGVDGIYVVSKCASFDSIAYGSARTVPVLMALGEASGAMAKFAIQNNVTTRNVLSNSMNLTKVRNTLYNQGVRLVSYENEHPIDSSYAAREIKFLRSKAFVSMTYQNEYGLTTRATVGKLSTMLTLMQNNSPYNVKREEVLKLVPTPVTYELKLNDFIRVMNYFMKKDYISLEQYKEDKTIPEEIYNKLMQKSYLAISPTDSGKKIPEIDLTTEDMYAIMGNIIEKMPKGVS